MTSGEFFLSSVDQTEPSFSLGNVTFEAKKFFKKEKLKRTAYKSCG
jgi:hypothetical protein